MYRTGARRSLPTRAGSLVVVMTMSLLAACAPATTSPLSGQSGAPGETQLPGGEITEQLLTIANFTDIQTLDPRSSFGAEFRILVQVYEGLTRYDVHDPEEPIKPYLAESWESSEDAREWTFHLRSGVLFHDGTPFTAEAVKYSIERVIELGEGAAYLYESLESIEVIDDLTVRIVMGDPLPLDVIFSGDWGAWIMSPSIGDQDAEWFNAGNGIGTGPYRIVENVPGERLVLTRFEDYWQGWEEGQYTDVTFDLVTDPATRTQAIGSGDANVAIDLPIEAIEALAGSDRAEVQVIEAPRTLWIALNTQKPPLDDPAVRQAMVLSFPYDTVREQLTEGQGFPLVGYLPSIVWGLDPSIGSMEQDLDAARQLLEDAGVAEGELTIEYVYLIGNTLMEQIGPVWQAALSEMGVNLTLQGMEITQLREANLGAAEDASNAIASNWFPTYMSPYDYYFSFLHSGGSRNFSHVNDPMIDELIDRGHVESATDREQATATFTELQEYLDELAVMIPVMAVPEVTGFSSDVQYPDDRNVVYWVNVWELRHRASE